MDTNFLNYDKSKKSILKFDVTNCNTSFLNSLRRLIITNITTIGFHTDDYQTSDLKVLTNTSSLHNEFLLHRIGLIPIFSKDIENYDPSNYKFTLNVKNETQQIINVKTDDFEIMNLTTNVKENTELFFPKNEITNDHILITRLKPGNDSNGEHIHIEGKSTKGIGADHVKFSPVSNVLFTNKIDAEKMNIALTKYLAENTGDPDILTHKFNLEESQRHFYTDANDDPNQFEFNIETRGVLEPHIILIEGLKQLLNKLNKFNVEFNKSLLNNDSSIEIKNSPSLMKAFDITVHNETHTLGHVLQSYVNLLNSEKNIFVGYINPHPLEKKIIFRVKVESKEELKNVFTDTTTKLINLCESLISEVEKEFTISVKSKSKKKKFVVSGKKSKQLNAKSSNNTNV
jgi:DNA-directed RNA polymerase II subunit RPB3